MARRVDSSTCEFNIHHSICNATAADVENHVNYTVLIGRKGYCHVGSAGREICESKEPIRIRYDKARAYNHVGSGNDRVHSRGIFMIIILIDENSTYDGAVRFCRGTPICRDRISR
jgi:hypothetical protein